MTKADELVKDMLSEVADSSKRIKTYWSDDLDFDKAMNEIASLIIYLKDCKQDLETNDELFRTRI